MAEIRKIRHTERLTLFIKHKNIIGLMGLFCRTSDTHRMVHAHKTEAIVLAVLLHFSKWWIGSYLYLF